MGFGSVVERNKFSFDCIHLFVYLKNIGCASDKFANKFAFASRLSLSLLKIGGSSDPNTRYEHGTNRLPSRLYGKRQGEDNLGIRIGRPGSVRRPQCLYRAVRQVDEVQRDEDRATL